MLGFGGLIKSVMLKVSLTIDLSTHSSSLDQGLAKNGQAFKSFLTKIPAL